MSRLIHPRLTSFLSVRTPSSRSAGDGGREGYKREVRAACRRDVIVVKGVVGRTERRVVLRWCLTRRVRWEGVGRVVRVGGGVVMVEDA